MLRITVEQYLRELQKEMNSRGVASQATAELSYRPVLDRFFRALTNEIDSEIEVIFEPKSQFDMGRPDWRFHHKQSLGVYGYAEAKGINLTEELSVKEHEEQIEKYLRLKQNLMFTDGLDFWFLKEGEEGRLVSLVKKPCSGKSLINNPSISEFEASITAFFETKRQRSCSEKELIEEAALRASSLSQTIAELASVPQGAGFDEKENKAIAALFSLRGMLQEYHDANLSSDKAFSDFVSQVLIFGLLYAHRMTYDEKDSPQERYEKIYRFWKDVTFKSNFSRLRPFQTLIETLGEEIEDDCLGPLGIWYNDCRMFLSFVDLTTIQLSEPDYHTLFEAFLEKFDPATRFNFGVYYTPKELAKFTVALSTKIAKDILKQDIWEKGNKIIDPCCGTGTFLEEILKGRQLKDLQADVIGLEILPGPYTLAHYRFALLFGSINYTHFNIFLTDTLSDPLPEEKLSERNGFAEEQHEATLFCRPPMKLILGNPPVSDAADQRDVPNQKNILKLLEDWRPPLELRKSRQNIQRQIKNEFVKFFRWSCDHLGKTNPGLIAFLVPSTFSTHPNYQFARKWILKFFSQIWILKIDGDVRRNINQKNLFKTMQGRILLIGARTGQEAGENAIVKYNSINDLSIADKKRFLLNTSVEEACNAFNELKVRESDLSLSPAIAFDEDLYSKCFPLVSEKNSDYGIFSRNCSGIKLAPSSFLTHFNKPHLLRKIADIANPKIEFAELISKWFAGQQKVPKAEKRTHELMEAMNSNAIANSIHDYYYRPFVTTKVCLDKQVMSVLQRISNGGTRPRPDVISAFRDHHAIGIALTPAPQDVAEDLCRIASFCWGLPDNDLVRRGNARILSNIFPYYGESIPSNDTQLNNVSFPVPQEYLPIADFETKVVYYVYAILSSTIYLNAFTGALFNVDPNDWPRIPFPSEAESFEEISELGRTLALLEKKDIHSSIDLKLDITGEGLEGPFDLKVHPIIKPKSGELILSDTENREQIRISGIPKEVLEYKISGYPPIQQWCKIHSKAYSRIPFEKEHLEELKDLINKIEEQIQIIKNEIDPLVNLMLDSPDTLLTFNNNCKV